MVQGTDTELDAETDDQQGWSRRRLLRTSGAGVGLAAALGITAAAGREGDGDDGAGNETDGNQTGSNQTATDSSSTLFDDLVDPVWGYPLAADESDSASVEHVVEMYTEEGDGSFPDFPTDPQTGEQVPFEFAFDPVGLHVRPGTIVKFQSTAGEHTVTAFHEKYSNPQIDLPTRIPEDVPGFTSPPIVDDESWLYQFTTPGVYDILCLPHLVVGMVMRVVVSDPEAETESGMMAAQPADELPPNIADVLGAEELMPQNIVDAGSVAWADLSLGGGESTPTDSGGTPTESDSTPTESGDTPTESGETPTESGGS